MSLQEKYVSLLELANANGTSYELAEGDGVFHINGSAPDEETKSCSLGQNTNVSIRNSVRAI